MRTLLMLGAILAAPAFADILEPSHDCTQPDIPYEFENSYERDQFLADAEEYKSCIADFVEEQEEAMRKHKSAADSAVEEWNSFAGSI